MDSDVITLQRFLDPWENAIVTEEIDLSNAMLKFRRGHPAIAKACKKLVRWNKIMNNSEGILLSHHIQYHKYRAQIICLATKLEHFVQLPFWLFCTKFSWTEALYTKKAQKKTLQRISAL